MNGRWYRVSKKRPCRICLHPDWCTYTDDGAVCCMRRESEKPMRNGGWLHRTGEALSYTPPPRKAIEDRPLDAEGIWRRWFDATEFQRLDSLGMALGVDTDALRAIGCAWAQSCNAWAFPMKDARGKIIGIRLRNNAGQKWAVKGSKSGLFIPTEYLFGFEGLLYIVEGPTDLAAAMTLGLFAIGRAACLGQEEMILQYVRTNKVRRVVIVTDNDEPDEHGRIAGLSGATKLQGMLPVPNCVWVPPVKDIREFGRLGGNSLMLEACIKDLVWNMPARSGREAA